MGDGADMAIEQSETFEELRFSYHIGDLSDVEAFEAGIIDELGYEYPSGHTKPKKCRCCGKTGLHWGEHKGRWRLFDGNGLHRCPVNPLVESPL